MVSVRIGCNRVWVESYDRVPLHGNTKMTDSTSKRPKTTSTHDEKEHALMDAIAQADQGRVFELLMAGVDPSTTCREWRTPLQRAADKGLDNIVQLLLVAGAQVDCGIGSKRQSPLCLAAHWNRESTAKILLAGGASPDVADAEGLTPLHHTTLRGNTAIAELLLDANADVSAKTNDGETALHFLVDRYINCAREKAGVGAAIRKTIQRLLDRGASIDEADIDGQTPIQQATKYKRKALMELLLTATESVPQSSTSGSPVPPVSDAQLSSARL